MSDSRPTASDVLMRVVGLDKSYGGLKAVDSVTFDVYRGEVLALVGDNGGRQVDPHQGHRRRPSRPDAGHVEMEGAPLRMRTPRDADAAGIGCLHQGLGLVDTLDVPENVFLGRELRTRFLGPRAAARSRTDAPAHDSISSTASGSTCHG